MSSLPGELRSLMDSLCQLYSTPTWTVYGDVGKVTLVIKWSSKILLGSTSAGRTQNATENIEEYGSPMDYESIHHTLEKGQWSGSSDVGATGDDQSTPTRSSYGQLTDTSSDEVFSKKQALYSLPNDSNVYTKTIDFTDIGFQDTLDSSLSSSCFSLDQSHLMLLGKHQRTSIQDQRPLFQQTERPKYPGHRKKSAKIDRNSCISMPNLLTENEAIASSNTSNTEQVGRKQNIGMRWKKTLLAVLRPKKSKANNENRKKSIVPGDDMDGKNYRVELAGKSISNLKSVTKDRKVSTDSGISRSSVYISTKVDNNRRKGQTKLEESSIIQSPSSSLSRSTKPFVDRKSKLEVQRHLSKVNSEDLPSDASTCCSEVTTTAEVHRQYSIRQPATTKSSNKQVTDKEEQRTAGNMTNRTDSTHVTDSSYNSGYDSNASITLGSDSIDPMDSVSVKVLQTSTLVPTNLVEKEPEEETAAISEIQQILLGAVREFDTQNWVSAHSVNPNGQLEKSAVKGYRRHSYGDVLDNRQSLFPSAASVARKIHRTASVSLNSEGITEKVMTKNKWHSDSLHNRDNEKQEEEESTVISEDDVEICMVNTEKKGRKVSFNPNTDKNIEESKTNQALSHGTPTDKGNSTDITRLNDVETSDDNDIAVGPIEMKLPNVELLDKCSCSSVEAKCLKTRFETFWEAKLGDQIRLLLVLDPRKSSKARLQIAEVTDYKVIEQVDTAQDSSSIFCMVKVTFVGQDKKHDRWMRPSEMAKAAYSQRTC